MPKKTIEVLYDDYDGKELPADTEPISLSLGGQRYRLYLSPENEGKLRDFLADFTKDAEVAYDHREAMRQQAAERRAESGGNFRLSGEASEKFKADLAEFNEAKKDQRKDIQEWARGSEKFSGAVPGEKGIIKADLLAAYYADNPEAVRYYGDEAAEAPQRADYKDA
ncbi:histone-like nucleoid-structuring protein Lsr2 [Nocardioides sp. SOB44]|uniref:Histone-like nucleoid-structuring protein Lsr2 n=1 Tax=Nocardioides cremeus TaxID=3058044 RepID=A0ABT8TL25_9ACTN|nr:histone-like nucleoid-structuring protein Lsr2 [Nocardioides cremeus]MDO3394669.1 histone-like nucleoid-structuring protein Lsr2 [Nocardioides cremeus]